MKLHLPVPHRNRFEVAPRMPAAIATMVVSLLTTAGLGTAAATVVGSVVASIASTKGAHTSSDHKSSELADRLKPGLLQQLRSR